MTSPNYHETARTFSQKSSAPKHSMNKLTLNEPAMTLQFLSNFFLLHFNCSILFDILSHSRSVHAWRNFVTCEQAFTAGYFFYVNYFNFLQDSYSEVNSHTWPFVSIYSTFVWFLCCFALFTWLCFKSFHVHYSVKICTCLNKMLVSFTLLNQLYGNLYGL